MTTPVTLVTGAAGGIGRAVCQTLLTAGHRLVVCDAGTGTNGQGRDPLVVEHLKTELGGEVVTDAGDVTDPSCAERCVDLAYASFGGLTGVIFLAGADSEKSVLKQQPAGLRQVLALHLEAPLRFLSTAAVRWTQERTSGSVVLTTGQAAFFGAARRSAHAAAEAGIVAAVRAAAIELRRYHIRVNAVAPTARTRLTDKQPLFRGVAEDSMSAEDVAPLYSYLISEGAHELSGEILGVAGTRVYSLQSRETNGVFAERRFDHALLKMRWNEITRN